MGKILCRVGGLQMGYLHFNIMEQKKPALRVAKFAGGPEGLESLLKDGGVRI